MNYFLDSHTLIWAVDEPLQIGVQATIALKNLQNQLLLSDATLWELGIKVSQGKLKLSKPFRPWMDEAILKLNLLHVHISLDAAEIQAKLPIHHKDPFDRMLVSMATVLKTPVLSADPKLDLYGITRIW